MKKLGIVIGVLILVAGCQRSVYRFAEGGVYGTTYHVSYQSDTDYAVEIRQEMERVNQSLSMFNKNSIIAKWNRGESDQVDSLFMTMYEKAKEVNRITDGAFDVTIAPLVNAWGFGFKNEKLPSSEKIDSLLQLLKDEFCEEEISKRRYLLEHREIIKTEVLFPNILEVNIPSKVYVGIIGIDRDDIITQSWSTPNKLKKSASMGKVLSKAFELLKITYCRDWFTFEDKILSFRPLDNRDEPLNKLVEIGTVEEYSVNEFANVSFKYEEALLHLINRSIEELASYKNIQWLPKEKYFRFKPIGVPRERKITWKNKKMATRSVVAEVWNSEKKQILYFRQLSFKIQSFRSNEKWFISITPGWSFTYDGYHSCKQESQLIAQKKNLESNSSVYQHFMFLSYCLTNKLEDNETEYKYISFSSPFNLTLNYTLLYGN